MLKILILAALLYGVYILFFKRQNEYKKSKKDDFRKDSETMVECQECGAYVSVTEAFIVDGKYFCSKECVDAYTRQ